MADYGLWQGLEKATGNMAATGMQLIQYKQQQAQNAQRIGLETQRLKIAQDVDERSRISSERQQKREQEQEDWGNAYTPASFFSKDIVNEPESKKNYLKMLDEGGYKYKDMGDEVYIQNKGYKHIYEKLKTDLDAKKLMLDSRLTDLQSKGVTLSQKIASGEIKGKDLEAAQQQQKSIKTQIANIIENQEKTVSAMAVAEAQKKDTTPKTPEFKKKITALVDTMGITEQEATAIVLGTKKVQKDPVTGEITIVDLIKNNVTRPTIADSPNIAQETGQPNNINIWNMAPDVAGPMSAAKAAGSVVSGMVGGPVSEQTIIARQTVTNAQNDLVRALSINPRFPVGEINRIREEINIAPAIFDNTETYRGRLRAIDTYLRQRIKGEQRDSLNNGLPVDQRRAARQAFSDISDFLDMLGVPPKGSGLSADEAAEELINKYR